MSKSSGDDERLVHHSHRLVGIGLLFLIGVLFLLVNFYSCYLSSFQFSADESLLAVFLASFGLLLAEPFVLLIWLVLGNASIGRRLGVCMALVVAFASSGFLGFSFHAFDVDRSVIRQLRLLFLGSPIMLVPVLIWAASLPLLFYHSVLGRRFRRKWETPERAVITIRGILLFTGMTALALSGIQWLTLSVPASQVWWVAGIGSAITATFSLLFIVTAVSRLMRDRGFWFWAWAWPAATVVLTTIILLLIQTSGFRDPFTEDSFVMVFLLGLVPLTFSLVMLGFLAGLRLLGFRICKP